jgi:hypothetical protein
MAGDASFAALTVLIGGAAKSSDARSDPSQISSITTTGVRRLHVTSRLAARLSHDLACGTTDIPKNIGAASKWRRGGSNEKIQK